MSCQSCNSSALQCSRIDSHIIKPGISIVRSGALGLSTDTGDIHRIGNIRTSGLGILGCAIQIYLYLGIGPDRSYVMPVGKITDVADSRIVINRTAAVTHTNGFIAEFAQANKITGIRGVTKLYQAVRSDVADMGSIQFHPATYGTLGGINVIGYRIDIYIVVAAVKFESTVYVPTLSLP